MTKCLTQLPTELLDAIFTACELSKNERLRLRLVCKAFDESQMITPLAFKIVRLQGFTREAFDHVFRLSQSRLAPYVTHFEYKVIEFHQPRTIHDVDRLIGLEPSGTYNSPEHIKEWAGHLLEEHRKWLLQQDIIGTFYDAISLSKSLPNFTSLKSVTISRFDPYAPEYPPLELEPSTTQAFWAVTKALSLCSTPIEHFSMEVLYPYTLMLPEAYQESCYEQIRIALCELKTLEVPRLAYFRRDRAFSRHQETLSTLLLTECIHLETVILGQHDYDDSRSYGLTVNFMQMVLPQLRVFELRMDRYDGTSKMDLVWFVRYHKKLRKLVLSGIVLRDIDGADPVDGEVPVSTWEEAFGMLRGVGINGVELDNLWWNPRSGVYSPVESEKLREYESWLKEKPIDNEME